MADFPRPGLPQTALEGPKNGWTDFGPLPRPSSSTEFAAIAPLALRPGAPARKAALRWRLVCTKTDFGSLPRAQGSRASRNVPSRAASRRSIQKSGPPVSFYLHQDGICPPLELHLRTERSIILPGSCCWEVQARNRASVVVEIEGELQTGTKTVVAARSARKSAARALFLGARPREDRYRRHSKSAEGC